MTSSIAVITGASAGIGAACVTAFMDAGHTVIGVDRADSSAADEHLAIDLADADCGSRIADHVADRPIGTVVNCAAIGISAPLTATAPDEWDRIMAINLRAPFLIGQALHAHLVEAAGSIVNIASIHARATSPGAAAYAASKGGLVSLTRAMAVEWSADGIRANCILPGAVDTAMLQEGLERVGSSLAQLAARHPLGRVGRPDEIARAAVFLASSSAGFITGAALTVDGGALTRLSTE